MWTERAGVKLHSSARMRDCIDVRYAVGRKTKPKSSHEECIADLSLDLSQCVTKCVNSSPGMDTLTIGTLLHSYANDCLFSGEEHLGLMGWHRNVVPTNGLSDIDCRALVVDSWSLPITAMLVHIMYCNPHASWWQCD